MRKEMMWFGAFLAVMATAFIACVPPSVRTTMLVPGASQEAAKLRKVAVLPFDGRDGKSFATEIEGALAGINIDDKQYFEVVDRVTLEKALNEMKLQVSGAVDPNTAVKLGRLIGAKGIYTGTVTASDVSDSKYNEDRKKCSYYLIKRYTIEKETPASGAPRRAHTQSHARKGLQRLLLPPS